MPASTVSIFSITSYLLLSNLGASIAEVANDAIVTEVGKEPLSSYISTQTTSAAELQSFVWMASSIGGLLGNLLGGVAITRFSPQVMFLFYSLILTVQFFTTTSIRESSINLPKSSLNVGIRKQLCNLLVCLKKAEVAYSITWLAASYAIIPSLLGTMFFYQTQYLKIHSSVLGISKVFGQAVSLLWSIIYNHHLKSTSARKVIAAIQLTMAALMVSDYLFVNGVYRNIGVPDSFYVVVFSGVLEVLFFCKILPFNVLISQLCPSGCEGSLMALVSSAIALSMIISGYLGVVLASFNGITGDDFSGFPRSLLIQVVCTLVPIYWTSCIPDDNDPQLAKKKDYVNKEE